MIKSVEQGLRELPEDFDEQLEEELRLAAEAARRDRLRAERGIEGDNDLRGLGSGWTVEKSEHPLPPDVAAKLAGHK